MKAFQRVGMIQRIAVLLVASCMIFLAGCNQGPSLALDLPDGAQRSALPLTMDEFTKTFNNKSGSAGVEGLTVGEFKKSAAGAYDRYTYGFDDNNRIVLDCPGGQKRISAGYLVNTLSSQESRSSGGAVSEFGASISIMIYAATENTAEEIRELLDALGITAVQTPDTGYRRGVRKGDIYYQICVEGNSIIFAIAALSPA